MKILAATFVLAMLWLQPLPTAGGLAASVQSAAQQERRYLYVGFPGSDSDLVDGGPAGILVFDIAGGHQLVRRISPRQADRLRAGQVRGIAADVKTQRLYVSMDGGLAALDLTTDRVVWERRYAGGCCDRLDLSSDGAVIYAPALGAPRWHVIDAAAGALLAAIEVQGFARQTVYARDGLRVFLGAWESRYISVADAKTRTVVKQAGPFGGYVCPFTTNSRGTLAFANVDGLVGFEVADLQTGMVLDRVIVEGSDSAAWPRYECPSHGIALTHDERELWVADGVINRLHVFDATTYPPVLSRSIALQAQPRWITFGIDGRYAYVSTGDVIDTASGAIVSALQDERGATVHSEKMIEIDFSGGRVVRAGRQTSTGLK